MYAQELIQNYAEIRSRLYGVRQPLPPKPKLVIVARKPEEPPRAVSVDPMVIEWLDKGSLPLNMLQWPSWRFLLTYIALKHGVTTKEIMSKDRTRHITAARHDLIYCIAKHTELSLKKIGINLGLDHTTCIHALEKFPKLERKYGTHANKGKSKVKPKEEPKITSHPKPNDPRPKHKTKWIVTAPERKG